MKNTVIRDIAQTYFVCHPMAIDADSSNNDGYIVNIELLKSLFMDRVKATKEKSEIWRYRQNLGLFFCYIGSGQELAQITGDMLKDILLRIRAQKTLTGTKVLKHMVSNFFDFCVEVGVRSDNPMDGMISKIQWQDER